MEKRGTQRHAFGKVLLVLVAVWFAVAFSVWLIVGEPLNTLIGSRQSVHDQELLNVIQWGDRFTQKEQGKVGEEVYTIYTDTVTGVMYVKIGDGITPIVDMDGGYAGF